MLYVFLAVFFNAIGLGIIIPLLPYFALEFGASSFVVTLLFSTFAAMQFFAGPIAGRLSDRFGRRPILLITLAGSAVSYVILASATSIPMLFLSRVIGGLMAGNMTVAHAIVADLTTHETRAKGLGSLGGALSLGFVFGPGLAGALTGSQTGMQAHVAPGFAAAALYACAFAITMFGLKETLPPARRTGHRSNLEPHDEFRLLNMIGHRKTLLLLSQFFLVALVIGGMMSTFPLWAAARMEWTPQIVAFVMAGTSIPVVFIQLFGIGHLSRRVGEPNVLALGAAMIFVGCALIVLFPEPVIVIAGLCFFFPGITVCNPMLQTIISQRTPPHHQGSTLGVANSFFGMGQIAGPMIAGFAISAVSMEWPFFSGLVIACAVFVFARGMARYRAAKAKAAQSPQ